MLYLDEIFVSIQGESSDSGVPCIFIRLFGCPVGCVYCDQPQDKKNRRRISLENLVNTILKKEYRWCKNVCITGGEPLVQQDVMPLVYELLRLGYKVSIETSGCVPIEECDYSRSYKYVMDIKGPSSKVSHKNIYENLGKLHYNDEVKFVIGDRKDYDFMKEIIEKYPTKASILVSPLFNADGKAVIGQELVEWLLNDHLGNVRVQIQLHKILEVK